MIFSVDSQFAYKLFFSDFRRFCFNLGTLEGGEFRSELFGIWMGEEFGLFFSFLTNHRF